MKKLLSIIILLFICSNSYGWWDTDWKKYNPVTYDDTKASGTVSDFPILVHLSTSTTNIGTFFTDIQSDGDDIVFVASDGTTKLSHEIEQLTSTDLWAWVKLPTFQNGTAATGYVYYKNPNASNQENIADVWSNNYWGVWHCNKVSTSIVDSTALQGRGISFSMAPLKDSSGGNYSESSVQGVAVSDDYIFITGNDSVYKFNREQVIIASATIRAPATFNNGDCAVRGSTLAIVMQDGSNKSYVAIWDVDTLTQGTTYYIPAFDYITSIMDIESDLDNWYLMEGKASADVLWKYDNNFSSVTSWSLILDTAASTSGYNGVCHDPNNNYIYCPIHAGESVQTTDVYSFDGVTVSTVGRAARLGYFATQGTEYADDCIWFSDKAGAGQMSVSHALYDSTNSILNRVTSISDSKVGKGYVFTNLNYIEVADNPYLHFYDNEFDITFWLKEERTTTWHSRVTKRYDHDTDHDWSFWYKQAGNLEVTMYGNNTQITIGTPPSENTQHKYNYTRTGDIVNLYLDGAKGSDIAYNVTQSTSSQPMRISAGNYNGAYNFQGLFDELRISSTTRTSNWNMTDYNVQNDPDGLITLGAEENAPSGIKPQIIIME